MSVEGDVDLDDLIRKQKIHKTKQIEKKRHEREQERRKYEQEQKRKREQRIEREKQIKKQREDKRERQRSEAPDYRAYYAISITGLVSDVSIDDICKLLGDRKIVSIKTLLRNKDRSNINTRSASLMEVVVVLSDKEEADSFVKTYSEKKLDGKYELAFSFVNPNQELAA